MEARNDSFHRKILSLSSIALFATLAFAATVHSHWDHVQPKIALAPIPSLASRRLSPPAPSSTLTTAPSATKPTRAATATSVHPSAATTSAPQPTATSSGSSVRATSPRHALLVQPPHRAALATCRLPEIHPVRTQPNSCPVPHRGTGEPGSPLGRGWRCRGPADRYSSVLWLGQWVGLQFTQPEVLSDH